MNQTIYIHSFSHQYKNFACACHRLDASVRLVCFFFLLVSVFSVFGSVSISGWMEAVTFFMNFKRLSEPIVRLVKAASVSLIVSSRRFLAITLSHMVSFTFTRRSVSFFKSFCNLSFSVISFWMFLWSTSRLYLKKVSKLI